jgi:hypothetical protein
MVLHDINKRLNPLKTVFNMKYLLFALLAWAVFCLCLPIWIITWDWDDNTNGWNLIIGGLRDMFGIDQ